MKSTVLKRISSCEVCGGSDLVPALDLGLHPMCDDLVPVGQERTCEEYPIEVLYCGICATAHQRYQITKSILFPPSYHYRARHTADVINGMHDLVMSCRSVLGDLNGKTVLDIGCNDGSLLTAFRQELGAKTIGVEPTNAAQDASTAGHAVYQSFISEDLARLIVAEHGHPDLITFTNVFAHIEDLSSLLRSIRLLRHGKTALVIENHYLGSIIAQRQFDTFYHEHPRTYSFTSLQHVATALGMRIAHLEFPARYGGNIRVIAVEDGRGKPTIDWNEVRSGETKFGQSLAGLQREMSAWKASKIRQISHAVDKYGKLPAKAFPGRAAIPVKLLGLDASAISAVYEKPGSAKIGHYVPGTRIPILSDDDFRTTEQLGPIINLAWHISSEIRTYLQDRGYRGDIIDIIDLEDFRVEL